MELRLGRLPVRNASVFPLKVRPSPCKAAPCRAGVAKLSGERKCGKAKPFRTGKWRSHSVASPTRARGREWDCWLKRKSRFKVIFAKTISLSPKNRSRRSGIGHRIDPLPDFHVNIETNLS